MGVIFDDPTVMFDDPLMLFDGGLNIDTSRGSSEPANYVWPIPKKKKANRNRKADVMAFAIILANEDES